MLRRNRSKLLGPTRPQQRKRPAPVTRTTPPAPPVSSVDERQFQGPPQGPPPTQGPPQRLQPRQTDWRQDWSGPGNARTMPPPPSITAFRPPIRSRMVAGPLPQPASTRMPIEDPVEQWTPSSLVDTPKKQSRANRATFMFAALLLIIVVVAYIVRKRNSIASSGGGHGSFGSSYGSSYGGGYSVNDGYANW